MRRLTGPGLALALAAALAAGAALFPRAAEPTRAHADGYALSLSSISTGLASDWYPGPNVRRIGRAGGGLTLLTGNGSVQLLSRPLAVYAGRCYVATVRYRILGSRPLRLEVADQDVRRILDARPLPVASGPVERTLSFDSGDRNRVTLLIAGEAGERIRLDAMTLRPSGVRCGAG